MIQIITIINFLLLITISFFLEIKEILIKMKKVSSILGMVLSFIS